MGFHPGKRAWIGLATYIVAYDIWALRKGHKTLSETFHETSRSEGGKLLVAFWVYLSLHLTRYLPEAADVFRFFGVRFPKKKVVIVVATTEPQQI